MIDESMVKRLCEKYKIKYRVFQETDTILLDSGCDEWFAKCINNKIKLMHKNKIKQHNKFHTQRWLRTINQLIDCVAGHKGVLKQIYVPGTYKNNNI